MSIVIEERDGGCGVVLRTRGPTREAASGCRVSGGFDGMMPAAPLWHGQPVPRTALRSPRRPGGTGPASVDSDAFREAMSRFPSGVTIVCTRDHLGRWWGFTASAFTSLSADPPLVLACLDNRARCHRAFMRAERFGVAILRPRHRDLALRFASKEPDKFTGGEFETDEHGLPYLPDALGSLVCATHQRFPGGDHTIIVGRVLSATAADGEPVVFCNRRFGAVTPAEQSG